ncbi:hypothetical protein IT398_02675 [Candidatus Nomurabacteria bacterium]|nr:hypothetical protein [Candidatus Nomurabacteria bacterium]
MKNKNGGLIKLVIIIIVAVLLLNYFQVNLVTLVEKLKLKPLFVELWAQIKVAWGKILELWTYLTNK